MNIRNYRQEAYRLKSHPESAAEIFNDSRDSFSGVYWSLLPFTGLELFSEVTLSVIPGGLIFPVGFFLFWAFYYTYYRPGHLEAQLGSRWSFAAIPTLFLGGAIWLIKVSVVELGELFLFRWWMAKDPIVIRVDNQHKYKHKQKQTPPTPPPSKPTLPSLPDDVRRALSVLGLHDTRDWNEIHRRYRDLAKQYHPDLNPNLTTAGTRFITYDSAFKKLSMYRSRFFNQRAA